MPRLDYKTCKVCGRHESEVGAMSHMRLCSECSAGRFLGNLVGMKTMSGPFARHWRQSMAASVGGVLLDDVRVSE